MKWKRQLEKPKKKLNELMFHKKLVFNRLVSSLNKEIEASKIVKDGQRKTETNIVAPRNATFLPRVRNERNRWKSIAGRERWFEASAKKNSFCNARIRTYTR